MRNTTIDNAKGIGILAVVLSHNWYSLTVQGELFRVLFSFHMPLFFFLSGIFFKAHSQWMDLLKSKADSILKPFFVVSLGLFFTHVLVQTPINKVDYLQGILYAAGSTIEWGPMWFLPHLFAVFVFSWLISQLVFNKIQSLNIKFLLLFMLLFLGVQTITLFWETNISIEAIKHFLKIEHWKGLPYSVDIILISSVFFIAGHFLADKLKNFTPNFRLIILAVALFSGLHYFFNETMVLANRVYGNFIISTLQALLGIYIVLSVSGYATLHTKLNAVLSYIGSASLFILIFHFYIQAHITFSFLYHYPNQHFVAALLGFLLSVACSLIIFEITKRYNVLQMLMLPLKIKQK